MSGMDFVRLLTILFNVSDPDTSQLIAGSRQVFAFSRDQALPLSGWLYNINPQTKTPVHAVVFLAAMAILLGLLSFAGMSYLARNYGIGRKHLHRAPGH
jgi:amino acid transporter